MLLPAESVFCVYRIRNTVNDKIYIGITCTGLAIRWSYHKTQARKGKSKNQLYQDIEVYGAEAFSIEVIEDGMSSSEAHEREVYWIDRLCSVAPHGYNMDNGSMKRAYNKQKPWIAGEDKRG